MFNQPFTPSQVRPIRPAMTVSRPERCAAPTPTTALSIPKSSLKRRTLP